MGLITKMFGTRSEREVKKLMPQVQRIEALGPEMAKLTDEQLREKTEEFKRRYQSGETLDELLPEARVTGFRVLPGEPEARASSAILSIAK